MNDVAYGHASNAEDAWRDWQAFRAEIQIFEKRQRKTVIGYILAHLGNFRIAKVRCDSSGAELEEMLQMPDPFDNIYYSVSRGHFYREAARDDRDWPDFSKTKDAPVVEHSSADPPWLNVRFVRVLLEKH